MGQDDTVPVIILDVGKDTLSILFGKIIFTWIEYARIGVCLSESIGDIKDIGFESYIMGLLAIPNRFIS